jgi:hypothetical protein
LIPVPVPTCFQDVVNLSRDFFKPSLICSKSGSRCSHSLHSLREERLTPRSSFKQNEVSDRRHSNLRHAEQNRSEGPQCERQHSLLLPQVIRSLIIEIVWRTSGVYEAGQVFAPSERKSFQHLPACQGKRLDDPLVITPRAHPLATTPTM